MTGLIDATVEARKALGVPDERFPKSVAIIMDGNGRWAKANGLPRSAGHEAGAKIVRCIVIEANRLGLDAMTLYSFSQDNWSRPADEIKMLMHLYAQYLVLERPTLIEQNVRLRHLGRREGLPASVLRELDASVEACSQNTGMYLCLALNYGSRSEMVDAARRLGERIAAGELEPNQIDERAFAGALDSASVPDPDLIIRTAGERRLSNFLLWQSSYAEFYVTDKCWPDFAEADLHEAIRDYSKRHRRFGGLNETAT